jgi:hypothetical protein
MKRITYEIFGKEAEIVSYTDGGGKYAEILFKNVTEGYFTVGDSTHKISCGALTLNLTLLPDGEISPTLTANGAFISLPSLFKDGTLLCPSEIDDEYVRDISIRQRRANIELTKLQEKVSALEKSVFGTKIF